MKKDLFLFIDYAGGITTKVQAWTLKDLIAQMFEVDEDDDMTYKIFGSLQTLEYDTWIHPGHGFCIVMLPKK